MGNHTAMHTRGRSSAGRANVAMRGSETPEDRAYAAAKAETKAAARAKASAAKATDKARIAYHRASMDVGTARTAARGDIHTRTGEEAGRTRAPVAYARYVEAKAILPAAERAYQEARDKSVSLNRTLMNMHASGTPYSVIRQSEEYKALSQQLKEAEKAEKAAAKPYYDARRTVYTFLNKYGHWATNAEEEAHPALRSAHTAENRARAAYERAGERLLDVTSRHERAQEAERRAAGAADRSHGGPGMSTRFASPSAERTWHDLLGARATNDTLRRITGAREGDRITVSAEHREDAYGSGVQITREGTGGAAAGYTLWQVKDAGAARELGIPRNSLVMNVGFVGSGTKTSSSGRDLINAFSTLRDLGVRQITASAARGATANGYYTWAQIGGQGRIPDSVAPAARATFGSGTTRVEQIMDKPGGPAWWREHGDTFPVTLDLSPNGRTSRFLDSYESIIRARAARGGSAV